MSRSDTARTRGAPTDAPHDARTGRDRPRARRATEDEPGTADADALAAIAAHDHRRAITILMNRHGRAVYRFIWAMIRDDATADDLHQQVFIEAYRGLGRFAGRSTITTWLYGIARHRCLDELRRRRRREPAALAGLAETMAIERGPRELLADRQVAAALEHCLHALSPSARVAVHLHFHDGLTYGAIGEICAEPAGTIQQRVFRALIALRTCIQRRTGGRL